MSNTIPIIIEETFGIDRINEPVTVGIPFPKGFLKNASELCLIDTDYGNLPLQTQPLAVWPDGSIKWLLHDFQVSAKANTSRELELKTRSALSKEKNSVPEQSSLMVDSSDEHKDVISVDENKEYIHIKTNVASFFVNVNIFKPFDRVVIDGNDVLNGLDGKTVLTCESGIEYVPQINNISIETKGALRTTIKIEGVFKTVNKPAFANFFSRVTFFANSSTVKVDFTIHNQRAAKHPGGLWDLGDLGSIFFKDLSIYTTLNSYESSTISYQLNDDPSVMLAQQNTSVTPLENNELNSESNLLIYQDSSGGKKWDSLSHINRNGEVRNSFRGYKVYSKGEIAKEGLRANPILSIRNKQRQMSGAVQGFWQNFPKSIEAKKNTLIIRLFPKQYNDLFELQGGEQKTHTYYFDFSEKEQNKMGLNWIFNPLVPRTRPEHNVESMAFGYVMTKDKDRNSNYQELVDHAIRGENNLFDLREYIDEYGWRNFGEVYANHEVEGYNGSRFPFISHYNNQYDIIHGCILQYVRTGDPRWYQIMHDLAKHVIDIDIYHTKKDRPTFSGGAFWHTDHFMHAETSTHRGFSRKSMELHGLTSYGGGPTSQNCYITGLCMYYYLTGNAMAKEAAIELADWIINGDKLEKSFIGIIRRVKFIISSFTNKYSKAPGRGQANSINALLDVFKLTNDRKYILKADGIIKRYISPVDDIDRLNQQVIEMRWFYLIFLQSIGKYLDLKDNMNEYDKMFTYAKKSLLHHANWMLNNEKPYKQLFHLVEIPSTTWPAQDIRKSIVFDYAYKYSSGAIKDTFKDKAEYFYNNSISDVLSFEDKSGTFIRPLAVLMHYGVMHTYFQNIESM